MKKIILSIIAFAIALPSFAQWTYSTTNNNNIYNLNTGNVGIGTATPAFPLDILVNANGTTGLQFTNANTGTAARTRFSLNNGVAYAIINLNSSTYPTDPNSLSIGAPYTGGDLMLTTGGGERMRITTTGKVGIGTTTPAATLDIKGSTSDLNAYAFSIRNSNSSSLFSIRNDGRVDFPNNAINMNNGPISLPGNSLWAATGNLGIGTVSPDAKLSVEGTIHTQEVKVDMNGWNDFVFDKTYRLPALSSVKKFIDQNHHLPEMPSEAEVIKNGINLGEMVKLQTKKIEELTLYLIDKDKQIEDQNKQLTNQQAKSEQQDARIEAMEKTLAKLTAGK